MLNDESTAKVISRQNPSHTHTKRKEVKVQSTVHATLHFMFETDFLNGVENATKAEIGKAEFLSDGQVSKAKF